MAAGGAHDHDHGGQSDHDLVEMDEGLEAGPWGTREQGEQTARKVDLGRRHPALMIVVDVEVSFSGGIR